MGSYQGGLSGLLITELSFGGGIESNRKQLYANEKGKKYDPQGRAQRDKRPWRVGSVPLTGAHSTGRGLMRQ